MRARSLPWGIEVAFFTAALLISLIIGVTQPEARSDFQFPVNPASRSGELKPALDFPNSGLEVHKINRMALTVTNTGFFGKGYFGYWATDPETGLRTMSCEYPINSDIEYLFMAGLWFGAIIGYDTLVSTGAEGYYIIMEFLPDAGANGAMIRRSSRPFSKYYSSEAVSEEDISVVYTDTVTNASLVDIDPVDNRPHQPLNIEVTQRSFAWSYAYAEDFIIFDFAVRNIGRYPLKQMYMGLFVDADAYHLSKLGGDEDYLDDICGYKEVIPSPFWPGYQDTIRIAWVADNDGDPSGNSYDYTSTTGVTATRVLRASDSLEYSFNWWVTGYSPELDWGPRQITDDKPYRYFGPNFGTPLGDRNKYYMLSTREFDYDQMECAVSHADAGWMPPGRDATDYADGSNAIYLLSFGPYDLPPGDTLPITFAYVGGENFHHNPSAFNDLYSPYNPYLYMNQLSFNDLGRNAIWAEWIFDNPGYDTDGDRDSGLARWFVNSIGTDSTYAFYKGDGVPDFRGAAPPPSPKIRVTPGFGKLIVRWNGQVTENFIDVFLQAADFEGYKVYYGEDNRSSDFVLLAAYDVRDYNRCQFNPNLRRWEVASFPFTYDTLQIIYGPGFDPDLYTEANPLSPNDYRNPDGLFTYFTPLNWNASDLSDPLGIHRVYPDADRDDPSDTTDEGYHRFYEYEFTVDNMPPSRPVYVSVTAFDFGSRTHQLSSLESSLLANATLAYPLASTEEVEEEGLDVIVYPNPYRIDDGYARAGYENRDRTRSSERARAIHFANLPNICTIRIYTVDGDLVREIKHYRPDAGPDAQHEEWNMLSRNTQAITTGVYLWSVTSSMGDQLGKLVIIK